MTLVCFVSLLCSSITACGSDSDVDLSQNFVLFALQLLCGISTDNSSDTGTLDFCGLDFLGLLLVGSDLSVKQTIKLGNLLLHFDCSKLFF